MPQRNVILKGAEPKGTQCRDTAQRPGPARKSVCLCVCVHVCVFCVEPHSRASLVAKSGALEPMLMLLLQIMLLSLLRLALLSSSAPRPLALSPPLLSSSPSQPPLVLCVAGLQLSLDNSRARIVSL